MSLFGFITFLSFALPVLSESSKNSWTSCTDGYGLNYTLPMFERCKVKPDRNGNMVQTIPKVIPFPSVVAGCHRRKSQGDIPAGHRICRIPDCGKNLCKKGWCEETFTGFKCHCYTGFQGEHCDEVSTETATQQATTKSTTGPTTTIPVQEAATSQDPIPYESAKSATTEAKSKPKTRPTTTKSEQPETTTSKDTANSESSESATSEATTKLKTSPTTMMSKQQETTSHDTTTPEPITESQNTEATSKPTTSPTTTKLEQPETTTSRDTTTSEPTESQTTEATSKPTTSPSTTKSDQPETTTSQDTTTPACTSPIEVLNGGSFYNFSTCKMNHASALSSCSEHDSHLVYIESEEEQYFIENQIDDLDSDVDYWIGLTGQSPADARWLDGSSLTYYGNLHLFSFDEGHEGGGCFRILRRWSWRWWEWWYIWQEEQCSSEKRYICEKEICDNA